MVVTLALMSMVKPVLLFALVLGWAWCISFFDKDLDRLALKRQAWNAGQMAGGVVGLLALLFIPWFILGFILALLLMGGPIAGYIVYRNTKVNPQLRWNPLDLSSFKRGLDEHQQKAADKRAEVTILNEGGVPKPVPTATDPMHPAHLAFEELMAFALPRDAEVIELQVTAEKVTAVTVIDGVPYPQENFEITPQGGVLLINYVKGHARIDPGEQRKLQTGRIKVRAADGDSFVSVETYGSSRGLTMLLRPNPDAQTSVPFDQLGFLQAQLSSLRDALESPGRVFIVTCPQGQGLTTTIYSLTETHDPYTQQIVTLEEKVPFEIEGVSHNIVNYDQDGIAIAKDLAAIIRRDPQVIMIPRLAHNEVAKVAAESSEDIRYYLGLSMPDTFTALRAWCKAVGDLKLAGDSLGGILSSRLFRKLCPVCRVPYQPDPKMLRKMNLPADKVGQLYKSSGQIVVRDKTQLCPNCHGLGYKGRAGVYEVMVLDDIGRDLIAEGALDPLRAHLRKNQMLYLQEAAIAKVVEGTTSISEVTRLFQKEAQAQQSQTA